MIKRILLSLFLIVTSHLVLSQELIIRGEVLDAKDSLPIEEVLVQLPELNERFVTSSLGRFQFSLSDQVSYIYFSHVDYEDKKYELPKNNIPFIQIYLKENNLVLNQVEVKGGKQQNLTDANLQRLAPISLNELATPFNEFSQLVATLPGVVSNNELSSSYAVRGGNFDENLVYVNGIEIYRPFLVRAGQQEGLSFINPDLVSEVNFSAGGWENKYGDKLSSNLMINYKEVDSLEGNVNLGLLGASAYAGSKIGERSHLIAGARYKNARYLFNTFDTDGEYLPRFVDFQAFYNYKLGKNSSIDVIAHMSQNDYSVIPASRETDFGNFQQKLRFFVFYDGAESLSYRTGQLGIRFNHNFSTNLTSSLNLNAFQTSEFEYRNLEGYYRLCDVDRDLDSDSFDQCISERGAGSDFQYARNILDAQVIQFQNRNDWQISKLHLLSFGISGKKQFVNDFISEYSFKDSADFVNIEESVNRNNSLQAEFYDGYVQHEWQINQRLFINYGFRINFGSNTKELLMSPRMQIQRSLFPDKSARLSFSAGLYRQYPFYRELRNYSGELAQNVKAQNALHLILNFDKDLQLWSRPFKFMSAAYYKHYFHLIPYDVDNVRIRYRPELSAKGYATGFDVRLSGEFIPGTESWFSLGILSTKEDVAGDGNGYIRRPSDQRVTASILFQDHFRDNPDLKVNLKLQIGSGLPFGPPNSLNQRNTFTGEWYRRMDVGFSKRFQLNKWKQLESFTLGLDVLNVLGVSNTISYSWIEDVNNQNFAVPNSLSARFLNVKGILKF